MKRDFFLLYLLYILSGCINDNNKNEPVNGIWIPVIRFSDDSFSVLIIDNQLFTNIVSQNKITADSIYLMTEPGLILEKGTLIRKEDNAFKIRSRIVYRSFKIFGETLPSKVKEHSIRLISDTLIYDNQKYTHSNMISQESKKRIWQITESF